MATPLVSIIMPVFNGEKFLREAIDSLLRQTYGNWELLAVNDGSTDKSRDIILSYTDSRIQLIENEHNIGIIGTKNRAIDLAKGKYIATLDADDVALPTRIEKQVAYLEANPHCGLCATLHQEIDETGQKGLVSIFPTEPADVKSYLLIANCICHSSTMLRADLYKANKYDDAFYVAEDFELWDRICRTHSAVNLPEILTYYRVHGGNISITKKERMFETVKLLSQRILNQIGLPCSPEELAIHSDLISFTNKLNADPVGFRQMEEWILKFCRHIESLKEYNAKIVYKILADRYIVSCVRNRRFGRMLLNPVRSQSPALYTRLLMKKIMGRPIVFNETTKNR